VTLSCIRVWNYNKVGGRVCVACVSMNVCVCVCE
jgi:hypothetical protein